MRIAATSRQHRTLLIGALLLIPTLAAAEGDEAAGPPALESFEQAPPRQILLGVDQLERTQSAFRDLFHISTHKGLEYNQDFNLAGDKVHIQIYGPIVKKKPGLKLRISGITIADRPIELIASGTRKRQGLEFKLRF
jgi:hypothetical protein